MNNQNLQEIIQENNISLPSDAIEKFELYTKLLLEWNQKINLTNITEPSDINEKHYLDCLLPMSMFEFKGSLCDVGSGAGFPGVVLAIANKELEITLLEPIKKRCKFLEELIQKLELPNVKVINDRAEDYGKIHREIFDIVTARAVANLSILSEICLPLVKKGGYFVSMKGTKGKEELEEAKNAIKTLGSCVEDCIEYQLPTAGERSLLIIKKEENTNPIYPREYAQIKKKPL